jgi:hypothetical protein
MQRTDQGPTNPSTWSKAAILVSIMKPIMHVLRQMDAGAPAASKVFGR